ncbi:MAG: Hsp70 family protein, partial [Candidatus Promineifilaceae bacterium]
HEADDRQPRELIDARNQADQLVYAVEKTLRELGGKVPASEKSRIETLVGELKEAIQGADIGRLRTLTEQLQQASYALSQQLYQTQQAGPNGGGQATTNGRASNETSADNDVVEGEFQEI